MLQIDKTLISLDILEKKFICDIGKCHGVCCVEGDSGAPLTEAEYLAIDELLPLIWNDLPAVAQKLIKKHGIAYTDSEGDLVTTINAGRECVFTLRDNEGNIKCAFEKAWEEGRIAFRKPISCHLYPIRLMEFPDYTAVNYDKWDICSAARIFGEMHGVPLYVFLKEPLIRRFGPEWYKELEIAAVELKDMGHIK